MTLAKIDGTSRPRAEDRPSRTPDRGGQILAGFREQRSGSTSEPAERLVEPWTYDKTRDKLALAREYLDLANGPGKKLNMFAFGNKMREVRSKFESKEVVTGLQRSGKQLSVQDIPNPNARDGRWNPYDYLPRFAFDPSEDAFPVSPGFDGDADVNNNAPGTPNGKPGPYQDGVIGGKQPLEGGFSVSKKGDYTVLSYSFYYAHNKAGGYHRNDYSTAQVYLKPGADGKLEPSHLYTSFHHGGVLTRWDDLKKDADGRPIIRVGRGSHALLPVGKDEEMPKGGLQIAGDGSTTFGGERLDHRLNFEVFQGNVDDARKLDPSTPRGAARRDAMAWGSVTYDPLLPDAFDGANPWKDLGLKAFGEARAFGEKVVGTAVETGKKVVDTGKKAVSSAWDFGKGLFGL